MPQDEDARIVSLYEDRLHVGKVAIVTDQLRVTTSTDERAVTIDETVDRGNLHVERVAVEREVAQAPEPIQRGETLVISIVEERIVVEKRLYVVEELHITRTTTTERVTLPETVRTMRATVERAETKSTTGREIDG